MPQTLSVTQAEGAYAARLKELGPAEWNALDVALQRVEAADSLGAWTDPFQLDDGSWRMAYASLSTEANDFIRALDDLGLQLPFDWPSWDQRRTLAESPDQLAEATPVEAAMFLFALGRSDRFVEGELLGAFESGLIQRSARRLLQAAGTAPPDR